MLRKLLCLSFVTISLVTSTGSFAKSTGYSKSLKSGDIVGKLSLSYFINNSDPQNFINGFPVEFNTTGTKIDEESIFGATASVDYYINENFVMEGFLGFFRTEEIDFTSDLTNLGGEVQSATGAVGLFPVGLIAQYHPAPHGDISPYIGAGYHYTFFSSSLDGIDYENASGPVAQIGADWRFKGDYIFSFDIKKVWMETTADFREFSGGIARTKEIDYNPFIVSIGFGYKF